MHILSLMPVILSESWETEKALSFPRSKKVDMAAFGADINVK